MQKNTQQPKMMPILVPGGKSSWLSLFAYRTWFKARVVPSTGGSSTESSRIPALLEERDVGNVLAFSNLREMGRAWRRGSALASSFRKIQEEHGVLQGIEKDGLTSAVSAFEATVTISINIHHSTISLRFLDAVLEMQEALMHVCRLTSIVSPIVG